MSSESCHDSQKMLLKHRGRVCQRKVVWESPLDLALWSAGIRSKLLMETISPCLPWVPMTSQISSPIYFCLLPCCSCHHIPASGPLHLLFLHLEQTDLSVACPLPPPSLHKRHLFKEPFPDHSVYHYTHSTLCPLNLPLSFLGVGVIVLALSTT